MLAWFSQHPICQPTLQQLTHVRQRWQREDVEFVPICTDPEADTDEIAALLQQWSVNLPTGANRAPFARDVHAVGRDVFAAPSVPTLVVLDQRGRLHVFDVGYNPNLSAELDLVLRMLQDGKAVSQ